MLPNNWNINKNAAADLLRNPDTSALVLFIIAAKTIGEENIFFPNEETGYTDSIDPLELFSELEDEFSVQIPVEVENKLNAILMLFTSQMYFEDPIAFVSVSLAVASGDLGELINGVMEEPTIEEILQTKMEVDLLIEKEEFSDSVQRVISDSLKDLSDADEDDEGPSIDQIIEEHRANMISELTAIGVPDQLVEFVKAYELSL